MLHPQFSSVFFSDLFSKTHCGITAITSTSSSIESMLKEKIFLKNKYVSLTLGGIILRPYVKNVPQILPIS